MGKSITSFLTAFEKAGDVIDEAEATLLKVFQHKLAKKRTCGAPPLERLFLQKTGLQFEVKEALRALEEAERANDVSTIILCSRKLPTSVLGFSHEESYILLEEPCGVSQDNVLTIRGSTARARKQDDKLGSTGSFPGHITIRDRFSAIAFALYEHKASRRDTDRMALWVDASVSSGTSFSGMAVAFKQWCDDVSPKWTVKSYKIHEEKVALHSSLVLEAEIWAIRQALQVAQERISQGDFSTRARAAGPVIVVIYSDSQQALRITRNCRLSGQSCRALMLEGVIAQANALRAIGAQIYLHWVPGHAGIPGNVLADRSAKRATKNDNLRSNNFQELVMQDVEPNCKTE